jgi:hypothetical protein
LTFLSKNSKNIPENWRKRVDNQNRSVYKHHDRNLGRGDSSFSLLPTRIWPQGVGEEVLPLDHVPKTLCDAQGLFLYRESPVYLN